MSSLLSRKTSVFGLPELRVPSACCANALAAKQTPKQRIAILAVVFTRELALRFIFLINPPRRPHKERRQCYIIARQTLRWACMFRILCLLLSAIAVASAQDQKFEFRILDEGVLQQRLRLANPKNPERYKILKGMFAEAGCGDNVFHEQSVRGSKQPNMICGIAGTGADPRKIIVGAHFDSTGGDGIVDNWSGAVLLPVLFAFVAATHPHHEFEFVGFAAEEKELLGSQTYLKSIPKSDRHQIAAVIVMDSLGLSPTKCWINGSTPELVSYASRVAAALKLGFSGVNVDNVGTTDSAPFKDAHIPVLVIHSVTHETWSVINSKRDIWSAVSWKDYYDTHKLLSALVNYLDQILP